MENRKPPTSLLSTPRDCLIYLATQFLDTTSLLSLNGTCKILNNLTKTILWETISILTWGGELHEDCSKLLPDMTAKARLMFLLASFDNFLKNRETVFARFGDSVALSVASPSGTLSFRVIPLTTLCRVAGQNCGLISIEKMVDWLLKEALNRKYLQYYFINLVDLHGLDLEWAFRLVICLVSLPKVSSMIDVYFTSLADHLWEIHGGDCPPCGSVDAMYLIMYCITMLDTDMREMRVIKKMTLDQFKRQLIGVNSGVEPPEFPEPFLAALYGNLQHWPLVYCTQKAYSGPGFVEQDKKFLGIPIGQTKVPSYFVIINSRLQVFSKKDDTVPKLDLNLALDAAEVTVDPAEIRSPADSSDLKFAEISFKRAEDQTTKQMKLFVAGGEYYQFIGATYWNIYRTRFGLQRIAKFETLLSK